jgi:hypothetical protein
MAKGVSGSIVVPDAIEPVVGWRSWVVCREKDGAVKLRSVIRRNTVWPHREELGAKCVYAPQHERHGEEEYAPAEGCSCGIYASTRPRFVRPYITSHFGDVILDGDLWRAFGRVSLWGRVIEGTNGARGELAYPHSIALPATAIGCVQLSVEDRQALAAELREAYGIPVVVEVRRPLVRRLLRR